MQAPGYPNELRELSEDVARRRRLHEKGIEHRRHDRRSSPAPLGWKEVWCTRRAVVPAGNIVHLGRVPGLSPRNLSASKLGMDFMLNTGYIKRDFHVHARAAPEFLGQAAKVLPEERWKTVATPKILEPSGLQATTRRLE